MMIEWVCCPHIDYQDDEKTEPAFHSGSLMLALEVEEQKPNYPIQPKTMLMLCQFCRSVVVGVLLEEILRDSIYLAVRKTSKEG